MEVDTVLLSDGGLHLSSDRVTRTHALPWVKIIVPLEGAIVHAGREGAETMSSRLPLVTAANVWSESASDGPSYAFFLPPEHAGFALVDSLSAPISVVPGCDGRAIIDLCRHLTPSDASVVVGEVARIGAAGMGTRSLEARVAHAKEILQREKVLRAEEVAQEVGLSPSRLSHLFSQEYGISLRAYALFQRLVFAFRLRARVAGHVSLAQIAMDAGFSDQAHLGRAARRYWGQHAGYGGRILTRC